MQQDPPQVGQTPQPQQRPPQDVSQTPQTGFYQPTQASVYVAPPSAYTAQPFAPPQSAVDSSGISWEASEYVHNAKGGGWIAGFLAVVAALTGLAVWLQVWTFLLLIVVMAVAMAYFAFRKPHLMQYRLTDDGVLINNKIYHYSEFKAFGILQDGAFFTMTLIPIKRLSPAISIYFAEDHGEQIVDIVGKYLPMEDIKADPIDTLMRRLRF